MKNGFGKGPCSIPINFYQLFWLLTVRTWLENIIMQAKIYGEKCFIGQFILGGCSPLLQAGLIIHKSTTFHVGKSVTLVYSNIWQCRHSACRRPVIYWTKTLTIGLLYATKSTLCIIGTPAAMRSRLYVAVGRQSVCPSVCLSVCLS